MSFGIPSHWPDTVVLDAAHRQNILHFLYLLIPGALLCSLFCARLGVERGWKLRSGSLPCVLFFGAWLFAAGWIVGFGRHFPADSSAFGLLLLSAFGVLRADPPAPAGASSGWTLAAGVLGALSMGGRMDAAGSVGGLGLYVWWAAGWRRAFGFALAAVIAAGIVLTSTATDLGPIVHAPTLFYFLLFLAAELLGYGLLYWMPPDPPPVYGPQPPGALPMASARRMVGGLLFLTLTGVPAAAGGGWEFVAWPAGVTAGLVLTSLLARSGKINLAAPSPLPAATPPPHVPILPR